MELPKNLGKSRERTVEEPEAGTSGNEELMNLEENKSVSRKRGRPPTSGEYIQWTAKKKAYNDQLRI